MATLTSRYLAELSQLGGDTKNISFAATKTLTNVVDQVLTIGTAADVTVFQDGASVAGATLTDFNFVYIQNLDTTNYVEIGLYQAGAIKGAFFRLLPGSFFTISSPNADVTDAGDVISTAGLITLLRMKANTAPCLVRVVAGDDA